MTQWVASTRERVKHANHPHSMVGNHKNPLIVKVMKFYLETKMYLNALHTLARINIKNIANKIQQIIRYSFTTKPKTQ